MILAIRLPIGNGCRQWYWGRPVYCFCLATILYLLSIAIFQENREGNVPGRKSPPLNGYKIFRNVKNRLHLWLLKCNEIYIIMKRMCDIKFVVKLLQLHAIQCIKFRIDGFCTPVFKRNAKAFSPIYNAVVNVSRRCRSHEIIFFYSQ